MDEPTRPRFGVRDAVWLAVIALALMGWAWDRNKLAKQVEKLGTSTSPAAPAAPGGMGLSGEGGFLPVGAPPPVTNRL
jgi:hypothetical protein